MQAALMYTHRDMNDASAEGDAEAERFETVHLKYGGKNQHQTQGTCSPKTYHQEHCPAMHSGL